MAKQRYVCFIISPETSSYEVKATTDITLKRFAKYGVLHIPQYATQTIDRCHILDESSEVQDHYPRGYNDRTLRQTLVQGALFLALDPNYNAQTDQPNEQWIHHFVRIFPIKADDKYLSYVTTFAPAGLGPIDYGAPKVDDDQTDIVHYLDMDHSEIKTYQNIEQLHRELPDVDGRASNPKLFNSVFCRQDTSLNILNSQYLVPDEDFKNNGDYSPFCRVALVDL